MIRIATLNLNGIRSANKLGIFEWTKEKEIDFLCVQEIRCINSDMISFFYKPYGLNGYFNFSDKKGYSGTGIFTKYRPTKVLTCFGSNEFNVEGRFIELQFGKLSIISIYIPSGSNSENRQFAKYRFLDEFMIYLIKIFKKKYIILCGDFNIIHKKNDIKNFYSNKKKSGCLLEERIWINKLFTKVGYVDIFRLLNKNDNQYTWWSYIGNAYKKNIGWRIDYHITTPYISKMAKYTYIFKKKKFSDHAPVIVDYDILNFFSDYI